MDSKNILIVTALNGFIRAFLLDDIRILQTMGYKIHCAANIDGDDYSEQEINDYYKKINVVFHNISFSSHNPLDKKNLMAYKQIKNLLKENDFKAIHIHTPIPGVLCRMAIAKQKKQYVILYTTHGFYFHSGSSIKNKIIFRGIESVMSRFTDAIVTINREDFANAKKMHCNKVYYINGVGVDTRKYHERLENREEYRKKIGINKNDIAILSVGELSKRKNHQIIIKALHIINDPKYVYVVCGKIVQGEGTYNELKKMAEDLNVRIIFLDYRTDIPQIAHSCDIGALPSVREGLGLAGIEMMAAGLPLVASNVHGIKDYVIDGITGFTVNPYDSEGFSKIIKKLSDSGLRKEMKSNCIAKAEEFNMESSHLQRMRIYSEML